MTSDGRVAPPFGSGDAGQFPATLWSLLLDAADPQNSAAVTEFAERYFAAVRAFILAIVRNADEADELTQQFFVTVVLQGKLLRQADQLKGRFRSFMKQVIRNFLVDEHRRR